MKQQSKTRRKRTKDPYIIRIDPEHAFLTPVKQDSTLGAGKYVKALLADPVSYQISQITGLSNAALQQRKIIKTWLNIQCESTDPFSVQFFKFRGSTNLNGDCPTTEADHESVENLMAGLAANQDEYDWTKITNLIPSKGTASTFHVNLSCKDVWTKDENRRAILDEESDFYQGLVAVWTGQPTQVVTFSIGCITEYIVIPHHGQIATKPANQPLI